MIKDRKTRLAFIGCGGWAQKKYLPFLRSRADVELVAVTDFYSSSQKDVLTAQFPAVHFYSDPETMIRSEKLDGIITSLPHGLYLENISQALRAGIPVLADKPAGSSYQEIATLVQLAKKNQVVLAVSSQRRSFPGVVEAKRLIDHQSLGRLHWLRYDFLVSSYQGWQKTWRNNPSMSGIEAKKQGILLDTGFHCIDSLLYSLNYQLPSHVFAKAKYHHSLVETDVMAMLEFSDGLIASVLISRNMPTGYEREVIVVSGEKGYFASQIEEKDKVKKARTILATDKRVVITPFDTQTAVVQPLNTFIEHLQGQPINPIYLAQNILPTMWVIDALYESILSNQQVEIKHLL